MFRLLIRDLSTGSVIRQHREKDYYGNWIKKTRPSRKGQSPQTMKSAFDEEEEYELTELGTQFVRYTMDEVMPRIAAPATGVLLHHAHQHLKICGRHRKSFMFV